LLAVVCPATFAVAVRVFAPIVASVAGVSARSVAYSLRLTSFALAAGVLSPVVAVVFDVPGSASWSAFPAVVDISDPD
jgi:hypothetical protein